MAFYYKTSMIRCHPRQPRFRIRMPRVQHIQLVLTAAHFPQVLYAVVQSVAVNVVDGIGRNFTMTEGPHDGMYVNMALLTSKKQYRITIMIAFLSAGHSLFRPQTHEAIVAIPVEALYFSDQLLLLTIC